MVTAPALRITEEDYLRIEREALDRSEYIDGEMIPMGSCSANHSLIGVGAMCALHSVAPAGHRVFTCNMRVRIPGVAKRGSGEGGEAQYVYPDCTVVCGEPVIHDGDNLLNPQMVVEVLSPSSESYDRGKKFAIYRSIPSCCEYLVFHQDRRHAEHYSKQPDGGWLLHEYSGGAVVPITRWNIEIRLAEVYEKAIGLDEEPEEV